MGAGEEESWTGSSLVPSPFLVFRFRTLPLALSCSYSNPRCNRAFIFALLLCLNLMQLKKENTCPATPIDRSPSRALRPNVAQTPVKEGAPVSPQPLTVEADTGRVREVDGERLLSRT